MRAKNQWLWARKKRPEGCGLVHRELEFRPAGAGE